VPVGRPCFFPCKKNVPAIMGERKTSDHGERKTSDYGCGIQDSCGYNLHTSVTVDARAFRTALDFL